MDEIMAKLLRDTNALGVWLLSPRVVAPAVERPAVVPSLRVVVESETYLVATDQPQSEVLAGAVKDPTVKPPLKVRVESESYIELVDRKIFALPIGSAVLVIVFDDQSSLGLIRLRVRHVQSALAAALTAD